jgi:hypothetical protein
MEKRDPSPGKKVKQKQSYDQATFVVTEIDMEGKGKESILNKMRS